MESLNVAVFRYHLPVVVALGRHSFEAVGLEPHFSVVSSSGEQRRWIEDDTASLGHTAIDNVAGWHTAAQPWAVARVVDLGLPHQLVARPGLHELADLSGRRVAVDSARSGFVTLLRRILEQLPVEGVEFVEVGALQRRLEAFGRGEADACLLGAEQLAQAVAAGAQLLGAINDWFPRYPGLVVTGIPGRAAEPVVAAYVDVLVESAAWGMDPGNQAEAIAATRGVLGLAEPEARAWYEAELRRCTDLAARHDQQTLLADAWRASGRIAEDQAVPTGWLWPTLAEAATSAARDAIPS